MAESRPSGKRSTTKEKDPLSGDDEKPHRRSTGRRTADVSPTRNHRESRGVKVQTLAANYERPGAARDGDRPPPRSSSEHANLSRLSSGRDDEGSASRHQPSLRRKIPSSSTQSPEHHRSTGRSVKSPDSLGRSRDDRREGGHERTSSGHSSHSHDRRESRKDRVDVRKEGDGVRREGSSGRRDGDRDREREREKQSLRRSAPRDDKAVHHSRSHSGGRKKDDGSASSKSDTKDNGPKKEEKKPDSREEKKDGKDEKVDERKPEAPIAKRDDAKPTDAPAKKENDTAPAPAKASDVAKPAAAAPAGSAPLVVSTSIEKKTTPTAPLAVSASAEKKIPTSPSATAPLAGSTSTEKKAAPASSAASTAPLAVSNSMEKKPAAAAVSPAVSPRASAAVATTSVPLSSPKENKEKEHKDKRASAKDTAHLPKGNSTGAVLELPPTTPKSGRAKTTDDLPMSSSIKSIGLNDRDSDKGLRSPGAGGSGTRSGKNFSFAERAAAEKAAAEERERREEKEKKAKSPRKTVEIAPDSPFPGVRLHVENKPTKEEGKPSPKENDKPEKRDTEHISNSNNNKGREDNRKEKERDGEQPAGKKKEDKRLKGIKIEEHKISISDLEKKLGSSVSTGLSAKERAERLSKDGQNINTLFPGKPKLEELRRDLDWHLVVCDTDYFFVLSDGKPLAVRRSGIVRGDILFVLPGQEVPADMRIISASDDLNVDPTNLTGVSKPARRRPMEAGVADSALEAENVLWQRTWIVQGWAKGLVFHTGNQCLTYRLLSGPESVNWVKITPLLRDAFHEHARCNAFVKRADALPELAQSTLLMTDIDVFKAGRPRLKALCIEEKPIREWQPLASVPTDPFADDPALFFLFRAVILCNESQALAVPTPPLSKYALKDGELRVISANGSLGTFGGEVAGGAWVTTLSDSVLLRDAASPAAVADVRAQLPAVFCSATVSIHAGGAPGQFVLTTRGSPALIVKRCSRVINAGKAEDLTEKRRDKWLRKASKQDKIGREVICYAQKEIVGEEHPMWDEKTAQAHASGELTLLGFVALEDELSVNLPAAIQQLASFNVKLLIASTRSAAFLKAWLEPLGLTPHLLDEPDLLKAITDEELKEAKFACGHLTPEARAELLKKLRDNGKHKVTVCAHGLDDGWGLRTGATDCLISLSSASYTAKVVADVLISDCAFPSLVACMQVARTRPVAMNDIQLLEGIGVTELPSKEACVLQ